MQRVRGVYYSFLLVLFAASAVNAHSFCAGPAHICLSAPTKTPAAATEVSEHCKKKQTQVTANQPEPCQCAHFESEMAEANSGQRAGFPQVVSLSTPFAFETLNLRATRYESTPGSRAPPPATELYLVWQRLLI